MKKRFFLFLALFCLLATSARAEISADKFAGKLLLVVDKAGELWYVQPGTLDSSYLGKPTDFLASMSQVALGISEKDLNSFKGVAPKRLAGNFLLRTEANGKIAYVNPANLKIYLFETKEDAIKALQELALGIKQADLEAIKKNKTAQNKPATVAQKPANNQETKIIETAKNFIDKYLLSDGTEVKVEISEKIGSFYRLKVTLNSGQEVESAITADGKYFYPQAINVEEYKKEIDAKADQTNSTNNNSDSSVPQTDLPKVELFVMSHCPYGTQMEKGILPVAKALGANIDFQIKFVDYAMHGEKEVREEMRQYCIDKNEPSKYFNYLDCFLASGDFESCLTTANIDKSKLNSCQDEVDVQYKILSQYNNQDSWGSSFPPFDIFKEENQKYGVSGSPTLVINGKTVNANRDASSLAKVICDAFTADKKPSACQQTFSTDTPAPGFGAGATSNTVPSSCGS